MILGPDRVLTWDLSYILRRTMSSRMSGQRQSLYIGASTTAGLLLTTAKMNEVTVDKRAGISASA